MTTEQEPPIRRMTDEEGRDMGESLRRLRFLAEKAPKHIDGLHEDETEKNE